MQCPKETLSETTLHHGSWWKRVRRSRLTQNFAAMFGTQLATYAFPLATIPYLARVLGPGSWGAVALAQSLGLYLSMVVEFGFNLSATRRIARLESSDTGDRADDNEQLAGIAAGVMGAKVLLAVLCLFLVVALQHTVRSLASLHAILWAGALSGIGQGFSMLWYFQGRERMKLPASVEVTAKAMAAASIFVLVHGKGDAWKVLGAQCVCYWGSSLVLLVIAYREIRFRLPTLASTREAMRASAAMFLFRSSVSLYTTANALVLGALSTPIAVGFYSGAEKLVKAMMNLLTPWTQTLFPRLSRLLASDRSRAVWLARVSLFAVTGISLVLCVATILLAPWIIRIVLGPGFEPAVPVLRLLALLFPAVGVSTVLGMQWMLPLGMDAAYNKIILTAGLLNLALAAVLARRWQQVGMAGAVVCSEYVVMFAVCLVLIRQRVSPFTEPAVLATQLELQLAGVIS